MKILVLVIGIVFLAVISVFGYESVGNKDMHSFDVVVVGGTSGGVVAAVQAARMG